MVRRWRPAPSWQRFTVGLPGWRLLCPLLLSLPGACGWASLHGHSAVDAALLQAWHEDKAALGPTFAGSPAWHAHMQFVEHELQSAGVVDVQKDPAPYRRWWSVEQPSLAERNLVVDGETVPVASSWAYSGSTPPGGITAPLVLYKKGMEKGAGRDALRGRIVVFQVEPAPASLARMFRVGHEWATDDLPLTDANGGRVDAAKAFSDDQWYQANFVTRFGRFDTVLRGSGAAGAVVVFAMDAQRLAGLYTFPLLNTGIVGVPGVYVAEEHGARVLRAAAAGQTATLVLTAQQEDAAPYFYTAVLPGRAYGTPDDRQVLLVTHSDGPNLTQENGALGILALVRRFARTPQAQRAASLRVLFDPQHYSPGRHTIDWYAAHPTIMANVTAVVGVEQLGQREYGMTPSGFGLTGQPEPWLVFVRDDQALIDATIRAIKRHGLPRTEVRVPERKGQGRWTGLAEVALKRGITGIGTLSGMSGYWSTQAGIESFDAALAVRQLDALADVIDYLAAR